MGYCRTTLLKYYLKMRKNNNGTVDMSTEPAEEIKEVKEEVKGATKAKKGVTIKVKAQPVTNDISRTTIFLSRPKKPHEENGDEEDIPKI